MNQTDYIEQTLEGLVRVYGLARVQEDLKRLLPRARWTDWQRLSNIAVNINSRLERQMKEAA
jgi:hypothetical protein